MCDMICIGLQIVGQVIASFHLIVHFVLQAGQILLICFSYLIYLIC